MTMREEVFLSAETQAHLMGQSPEWFAKHGPVFRTTLALQGWVFWYKRDDGLMIYGMAKRGCGSVIEDNWNARHGPTTAPPRSCTWYVPDEEQGIIEVVPGDVSDYNIMRFYLLAELNKWLC